MLTHSGAIQRRRIKETQSVMREIIPRLNAQGHLIEAGLTKSNLN
jgi:hypothetical protein